MKMPVSLLLSCVAGQLPSQLGDGVDGHTTLHVHSDEHGQWTSEFWNILDETDILVQKYTSFM